MRDRLVVVMSVMYRETCERQAGDGMLEMLLVGIL